jgi:hypothetical protein
LAVKPAAWKRRTLQGAVLLASAVIPACLCQLMVAPPRDRTIHIESFRYGKEPSEIRCNRGDRIHLTFSTRDTAHSFFLEEFDIDAKISPAGGQLIVFRPSDPEAPPVVTDEVAFTAEHPGWLSGLVSKSQFRCHVWCGPMHAFEQGNLVIEPNTLLFAALGLLLGIPLAGLLGLRIPDGRNPQGVDLFVRMPRLKRLMKRRGFLFALTLICLVLVYLIILTALFGTLVSGRNLGVMLTWVVWLFLLVAVLTPLGSRVWCTICPIPFLGDFLQRRTFLGVRSGTSAGTRNRLYGLGRPLPGWMKGAWPRVFVFLAMGTFSTLLVANPRVTGWSIVGLILAATIMAVIWRHRGFCRAVCPIGAFVGLYAGAGKLALRSVDPGVCERCKARSCQRGSENGWACPYELCVADIRENTDCGLCTECIKSCPHDNVTLRWQAFAKECRVRTASEAWLAASMLVLAVTYCVVHLGPWPALRDAVNILDKDNWAQFGVFAAILWAAALGVAPALLYLLAAAGVWLAGSGGKGRKPVQVFAGSVGALVPMGLAVWVAFAVPMLMVNLSFVTQSLSDPFGWGWDFFSTAGTPWRQLWPRAIPWIQAGTVLVGLGYGLRTSLRIWEGIGGSVKAGLRGMLPMGLFLMTLSGWLIFFFTD